MLEATALEDDELLNAGVWAYSFNRLQGNMWVHRIAGKGAEGHITISISLGRLQGFLGKQDELKRLPLWVAHYDLNQVNVLIDDDCNVTGLIDW
ncbi:hypothetical protein NUU61_002793 [Penicillium alfredii]|uniref:Aminoglycoside phosphotransferase domain-containing protein n=1 Tax=Penicillium alfredii TaxID=1506179 RepID=A0A9W9FS52_9EURO|nr:uncharacterized protein NUU61_002793 [Penicillium alfredii]KAJ5105446.1 hypothetical protein NUU61_002793 [Penicillium alfredii]